jgi:hypothetical protein
MLDNKLRSLRNSSIDSDGDKVSASDNPSSNNPRFSVISKMTHLQHPRPLTLGENIPFADESPERPLIQARVKPLRQSLNNTSSNTSSNSSNSSNFNNGDKQQKIEVHLTCGHGVGANDVALKEKMCSKQSLESSSDTDSSTTSNYRERMQSVIRLEDSVLRKVNRILTNLEHLERKYSLNRSLSLNYKSHRSSGSNNNNNECCCNASKGDKARLSLTKDEKTDKNINKRRQLHDTTNTPTGTLQATGGNGKFRRHSNGSRSLRRRHTVGGLQDYAYKITPIT